MRTLICCACVLFSASNLRADFVLKQDAQEYVCYVKYERLDMIERMIECKEFEKSVTRLNQKPGWYPVYLSGIVGVLVGGFLVAFIK